MPSEFGFEQDNYLGSTPQPNQWRQSWTDFWKQNRLEFQLELAVQNQYADAEFVQLGRKILERSDSLISNANQPPSLVHGDLWNGNYMVGNRGQPVLIDPAIYYADREVEFGMTTLFGGFDDRFYAAYHEVWPMEPGFETRIELYRLYHLLNHLNLFGTSYRSGCVQIMRKYS